MINTGQDQSIERSNRVEQALKIIDNTLNQYGYIELSLPIYEYYDLLSDTVFNFSDESIIRFIDRHTGKTLVLRPDFTPQVCRIVSGIDNITLPFRASYKGSVFRSVEKDRGIKSEENQTGWEIFGEESLYADMEIVLVCYDALKNLGLKGFSFTFADTVFITKLKSHLKEKGDLILKTVSQRRVHDVKKILENTDLNPHIKAFVEKLPLSFGKKDVLDELIKLSDTFDKEISIRLKTIKTLMENLIEYGISEDMLIFDGGESKGLDYYTGIHFEIVHENFGAVLGGGGRYDTLMAKFGKDITACGAALNIDNLLYFPICSASAKMYDYLILGEENFKKAIELRREGKSVIFVEDRNKKDIFGSSYTFKNII